MQAQRQLVAEIESAHGVGDEAVECLQHGGQQFDELAARVGQANKIQLFCLDQKLADLGTRFGVSRTHVRKLLVEAEELDLVRLTKSGGQFVELLPPVLQAFDRLVADAMSGFDLCYQLALRLR